MFTHLSRYIDIYVYMIYIYGSHLTNAQIIAYYILFIHRYTLRIAPPIFLSTKIFPLLETMHLIFYLPLFSVPQK